MVAHLRRACIPRQKSDREVLQMAFAPQGEKRVQKAWYLQKLTEHLLHRLEKGFEKSFVADEISDFALIFCSETSIQSWSKKGTGYLLLIFYPLKNYSHVSHVRNFYNLFCLSPLMYIYL
jgi:hypothetical protein